MPSTSTRHAASALALLPESLSLLSPLPLAAGCSSSLSGEIGEPIVSRSDTAMMRSVLASGNVYSRANVVMSSARRETNHSQRP